MKFAEFHAGQIIEAGPHLVTEAELVQFAKAYDPQWFHVDPALAAKGVFGGLIASGWYTTAIAMRLAVDAALAGSESFASPGLKYLKWPNPVRPGDSLRLVAEVLEARRSEKRPDTGILRWRWQLLNQHDLPALDLEGTTLFKLGAPG
ncbi:MAG: MaoC family dehydratase [Zoogloeaceae bacterium]|jgi:acyl dehydratase|nr:MaoC family dehydratase [Zoogloeaceae bacterium]